MSLRSSDIEMLLVSATRYALGRATYIVGWTINVLDYCWDSLEPGTKAVILRDIVEAPHYGMDMDKEQWFDFYKRRAGKELEKCP